MSMGNLCLLLCQLRPDLVTYVEANCWTKIARLGELLNMIDMISALFS